MGREPLLKRIAALNHSPCGKWVLCGINSRFQELFPTWGQVIHVFLTLAPLISGLPRLTVRLACLIHAASVRSEPESNSPNKNVKQPKLLFYFCPSKVDCCFQCLIYFSVFKESLSPNYDLDIIISIWLGSSHYSIFQGTPRTYSAKFPAGVLSPFSRKMDFARILVPMYRIDFIFHLCFAVLTATDRKFFSESASQTLSIRFHQRFGWRVLNLHLIFVLSSAIRKKFLIFFASRSFAFFQEQRHISGDRTLI